MKYRSFVPPSSQTQLAKFPASYCESTSDAAASISASVCPEMPVFVTVYGLPRSTASCSGYGSGDERPAPYVIESPSQTIRTGPAGPPPPEGEGECDREEDGDRECEGERECEGDREEDGEAEISPPDQLSSRDKAEPRPPRPGAPDAIVASVAVPRDEPLTNACSVVPTTSSRSVSPFATVPVGFGVIAAKFPGVRRKKSSPPAAGLYSM